MSSRLQVEIARRLAQLKRGEKVHPMADNLGGLMVKRPIPTWHPVSQSKFRNWVNESSDAALRALRELWARQRACCITIGFAFCAAIPQRCQRTQGLFTNVISVLLMGLDAGTIPAVQVTAFDKRHMTYRIPQAARQGADEATLYEHALGFLDQFIKEASQRGLPLRHRLDAQALAFWAIVPTMSQNSRRRRRTHQTRRLST